MKRYIKTHSYAKEPKYIIEIIINTEVSESEVAASEKIKHPLSVKKKNRLSDDELRLYNDFIDSMRTPIISRNFIIIREYQSKKSYAYYIDFDPVDKQGQPFNGPVRIQFRFAEHNQKHGKAENTSSDLIIKSFTFNDITYDSYYPIFKKVIDICNHLQEGDFEYVTMYRTN